MLRVPLLLRLDAEAATGQQQASAPRPRRRALPGFPVLPPKATIRRAVRVAAALPGFRRGRIGVMLSDDATIRRIHRQHLQRDSATDVISFAYQRRGARVEGELVVSMQTAAAQAALLGWSPLSELLLYVVHGTLHICGLDDIQPQDRRAMRLAEQRALARLGIADARRFSPDAEAST